MRLYLKAYWVFLFVLFSCASCKKDLKYTRIAGKVISIGSKQPIDSVLVIMQDGVASDFFGTPGNTSSDRKNYAYTDKNGHFDVELEGEHSAYIGFRKDKYLYENHQGGSVIGIKSYPEGTYLNEVFEMEGWAYFNGIFSNKPYTQNDSLFITVHFFYGSIDNRTTQKFFVNEADLFFFQPYKESSAGGAKMIGDTYFIYELRFTRNNQWNTKIDSVYIKSTETYRDTIYY